MKAIISSVRRVYFSALGRLFRLISGGTSGANPFDEGQLLLTRVAVLGRGESSQLFRGSENGQGFEAVVLCNFDERDLKSVDLRRSISESTYVILLANSTEPCPSIRAAREAGINCVIGVRTEGEQSRRRTVWRLNRLGLPVGALPRSLPKNLYAATRGTGIVGVAIASLLSRDVHVFGIEFYRTDYIAGTYEDISGETGETEQLRLVSQELQKSFELVAAHREDTIFTLHCFARHTIPASNVNIIRHHKTESGC